MCRQESITESHSDSVKFIIYNILHLFEIHFNVPLFIRKSYSTSV